MKKLFLTLIILISAVNITFAAEISNEAKLQYNQGVDYYRLGQYDKAMAAFRQAIAIEPNYIDAYYNLGTILEFIKQDDAALVVFKQIIVRNPNDYDAVYKAAVLSQKLGQTDKAKEYRGYVGSATCGRPYQVHRCFQAQRLLQEIAGLDRERRCYLARGQT